MIRNLKVYKMSGAYYKPTPAILLKGEWLRKIGFEYHQAIIVECQKGKIVISHRNSINNEDRAYFSANGNL